MPKVVRKRTNLTAHLDSILSLLLKIIDSVSQLNNDTESIEANSLWLKLVLSIQKNLNICLKGHRHSSLSKDCFQAIHIIKTYLRKNVLA